MKPFELHIGLTQSSRSPVPGTRSMNVIRGGPSMLLEWLEDQLALMGSQPDRLERVIAYLQGLDYCDVPSCQESLSVDAWSTARYLLDRRDELMMCGWQGERADDLPVVVNDLATVEQSHDVLPGLPDRLLQLIDALENGQQLPDHTCFLMEEKAYWPKLWRTIFSRMNVQFQSLPEAYTGREESLHHIQEGLASDGTQAGITTDNTFGIMQTSSRQRACSLIASILGGTSSMSPERTVIACTGSDNTSLLERTLREAGFPDAGLAKIGAHQPALQILPLVLEMLWTPVDPQIVLDFLTLPVAPFPDFARRLLTNALSEMPGLKSEAWDEARSQCIERASEPARMEEKLDTWFSFKQKPAGEPLPIEYIKDRCNVVSRWARGRAETLEEDARSQFRSSLESAASMAGTLKVLIENQGASLSKPQLGRILEDLQETISGTRQFEPTGRGPIIVESLADVPPACEHLIWLDTSEEQERVTHWNTIQRRKLREHDIDIDVLDRRLEARRNQERRGILRTKASLTVVQLTQNVEQPDHPLWLRIKHMLDQEMLKKGNLDVRSYLAGKAPESPAVIPARTVPFEKPQPRRPLWQVANDLLFEPEQSSATELEERLSCPARWMFKRVANLRASSASTLPRIFRLKGKFSHQLFEHVFHPGEPPPDPEEAGNHMKESLEERVQQDAAPLSSPERYDDLQDLKEELVQAAKQFADVLQRGNYRIKEIEAPIDANIDDKPVRGSIDCVLEGEGDREGIIDFKYAGQNKYRDLLKEGRAVQLAVYCEARRNEMGDAVTVNGTGYFILKESLLYTPERLRLHGTAGSEIIEEADNIFAVWNRFQRALKDGSNWLHGDEPVPARPLQPEEDWPDGAEMVIETSSSRSREDLAPCTYCDYKILCGLRTCE